MAHLSRQRSPAASSQLHLFKGKRQRGTRMPAPLELGLQCVLADVLRRWAMPGWVWTHLPMGERRDALTGARLKRMGVQPGWPDLILLPPRGDHRTSSPYFMEVKRVGGKLSEHQAAFKRWCMLNGYPHEVVHSVGEAVEILKRWGAVRSGIAVQ